VRPFAHKRYSEVVTLTPAGVAEFARAVGAANRPHSDPEFAAATRFERPIESGTQTTALPGLPASHYSPHGSMVGLEFRVGFRRPDYAAKGRVPVMAGPQER
jgi:acyl dehydratase